MLIVLALCFAVPWLIDLGYCEALTAKYGDEFEYAYLSGTRIGKLENLRVLRYSDDEAEVYYTELGMASGNVVTFVRQGGEWEVFDCLVLWDLWDNRTQEPNVVYPYWWDYFYAYFCENNA